ncbi:Cytochrome d ubiquinol oxidase subunit II [Planctomycetales bacterium 10988]|nr:Cytochrome d ubiquinol oxidase subunit II [Planctomycetales bacterium 10988]
MALDLHVLWFVLLGVLLAGYAVLDGFDFGVGILHLTTKTEKDRQTFIHAIGPIWDGNEVWLVTFGGALFAAFPEAYATSFSGFYIAFMLVLFCLIFRAISIEFRHKMHSIAWRRVWDFCFFGSSTLASLLFGVAVGAAMQGVPLNKRGIFIGEFVDQIGVYPLMVGVMTVAMFMMHGALYLGLKTEGELLEHLYRWKWRGFIFFLVMYIAVTIVTIVTIPRSVDNFKHFPWAWIVVVLNLLAIANIPRCIYLRKPVQGFVSSGCTIAGLVFLFGVALFPNLITSQPNPDHSLTIYNAASSEGTLWIMTIIAGLGMPFVITYTGIVYWTFRGKVDLDQIGY